MSVGNTLSGHIILAERLNYEERTRYLVVVQANVSQLPEEPWIFDSFFHYQAGSRFHTISLYFACIQFHAQQKLLSAIFGLNYRLATGQISCKMHILA